MIGILGLYLATGLVLEGEGDHPAPTRSLSIQSEPVPLRLSIGGSVIELSPMALQDVALVDGAEPALRLTFRPQTASVVDTTTRGAVGQTMVVSVCSIEVVRTALTAPITDGTVTIGGNLPQDDLIHFQDVLRGQAPCGAASDPATK
ncbi:MAG: hypothetical protein AAGF88_01680 [Pseudomonadota bacterium]